jgi:hypothetical protein
MANKRKPLKEGEFEGIRPETKEKYLKIGMLYFAQNWNYKDLEEQNYGSKQTIADALKYFVNYFAEPKKEESYIGALVSLKDRLKFLKDDLTKLRKRLDEERLKEVVDIRLIFQFEDKLVSMGNQISRDEELLLKLQGLISEKAEIELDITDMRALDEKTEKDLAEFIKWKESKI